MKWLVYILVIISILLYSQIYPNTTGWVLIGGLKDTDGDGVPDEYELQMGYLINDTDSDNDGIPDGEEDYDGDGLNNRGEVIMWYKIMDPDTDKDGLRDGLEDLDKDGLIDSKELAIGTDPFDRDTDKDGHIDGNEVIEFMNGTFLTYSNPLDKTKYPPSMGFITSDRAVTIPAFGNSLELNMNTFTANPRVNIINPGTDEKSLPYGITTANPRVSVISPGLGEGSGLKYGTHTANPRVTVNKTSLEGTSVHERSTAGNPPVNVKISESK